MVDLTPRLFVGYEIEGRSTGVKTLFVGDHNIPAIEINKALEDTSIKAVYFGACNNRGICEYHATMLSGFEGLLLTHKVILEINDITDMLYLSETEMNSVEIILVIPTIHTNKIKHINAVKLLSPCNLHMAYTDKWYTTRLDDPLYQEDITI